MQSPACAVPACAVPACAVPACAVPACAVPACAVPACAVPACVGVSVRGRFQALPAFVRGEREGPGEQRAQHLRHTNALMDTQSG